MTVSAHVVLMALKMYCLVALMLSMMTTTGSATTEWFGDLRAHLNPPQRSPFYDVTYDTDEDRDCPMGVWSHAIPDFVYFGAIISAKTLNSHSACLRRCLATTSCKAANFFAETEKDGVGFCELLAENQLDNPRLMRPFLNATYYERIRCRTAATSAIDAVDVDSTEHSRPGVVEEMSPQPPIRPSENFLPPSTAQPSEVKSFIDNFDADTFIIGFRRIMNNFSSNKKSGGPEQLRNVGSTEVTDAALALSQRRSEMLKRLAAKVREFNLRFRDAKH